VYNQHIYVQHNHEYNKYYLTIHNLNDLSGVRRSRLFEPSLNKDYRYDSNIMIHNNIRM
jgi:hypothetical protein